MMQFIRDYRKHVPADNYRKGFIGYVARRLWQKFHFKPFFELGYRPIRVYMEFVTGEELEKLNQQIDKKG